jgi:RNA polymerase sigma-70 factor (ECF subfamily)
MENQENISLADSIRQNMDKFTVLFNRYKAPTFDYAAKMLGDRETAGDVIQEVFMRLYETLNDHDNISDYKNWLFICTRNKCLNLLRDRRKFVALTDEQMITGSIAKADYPQLVTLQKAMAALDDRRRESLILKAYVGLSYVEIAGIMGITVPALRALIHTARVQLREIMQNMNIAR